jgi:hypothetical protein
MTAVRKERSFPDDVANAKTDPVLPFMIGSGRAVYAENCAFAEGNSASGAAFVR